MRTAIEREEEEVDSEITLSATTLLGIFFGLVLVCGVFFGFGYSTGRRGSEAPSASTPSATTPDPSSAPAATHTPKPSAMESLQAANSSTQDPNGVTESLDEDSPSQPSAPQANQPAPKPTPVSSPSARPATVPEAKPVSLPLASASSPAVSTVSVMVQIAAVTHQEDANALVTALRQRGYSVSVRNEPQDKLLHVQVGPFASRDEARAMRSKLLADGYNAILKP
jgi:cell division protein FtsN